MIVPDASVVGDYLVDAGSRGSTARRVLGDDPAWAVPEHLRAEVFSFLRRAVLSGALTEEQGARAVRRLSKLAFDTVPLPLLLGAMWQLRNEISGYDAAYVALAAERELTLVTADARLARAAVAHCRVRLVA